mgnify:FL=1
MSAFKVLNLRTVSSRVIMMLGFLSLGLISLVFSGGSAPPLFELALIISYLAFGDFFLSVYLLKSKDKTVMIILCSLLFFIELIFNFTFFFFSLKTVSVFLLSAYIIMGAYLSRLIIKKSKGTAFKLLPHLLLFLFALFFLVI